MKFLEFLCREASILIKLNLLGNVVRCGRGSYFFKRSFCTNKQFNIFGHLVARLHIEYHTHFSIHFFKTLVFSTSGAEVYIRLSTSKASQRSNGVTNVTRVPLVFPDPKMLLALGWY